MRETSATAMTDTNKAAFDARIIEKETHIAVVADNVVLGSFTGPKCKEHAELFLSALTTPAAPTQSAWPEKLPCDVTIGAATFKKGVSTRILIDKLNREAPTQDTKGE